MNKKHIHGKAGFIVANKINGNYSYGYINNLGKKILDLQYDEIVRVQNDSSNNDVYLVAFKKGQAGFYQNNKLIIEHEYQSIEYDDINKLLIVQKNQKQGIVSLKGEIKLPIEYDNILIAGRCINAQKGGSVTLYHPDGTRFQNTDFIVQVILSFKPILAFKNYILVNEDDLIEEIIFVKKGVLSVELPINMTNPQENIDKYLSIPNPDKEKEKFTTKKLSKNQRRPNRPYGGMYCTNCTKQLLKEEARSL